MAWTIPDKDEGDNNIQSVLFQEALEVLVEGISGKNCVLRGLAVTGGATTGIADNDTGAPGANEVIVNVLYK